MKKKKLFKRALAAVLTMTMALGVVPMTAFAEETSQAAQEAAAMRELESRVFEIGEEKLTIEDLEQADIVLISTADGQDSAVSGSEIRSEIINRPTATFVDGVINFNLTRITSTKVNITMTITLTVDAKMNLVEGLFFVSDTGGGYYFRYPYPVNYDKIETGTIWQGTPTNSLTLTFNNITMQQYAAGEIGIMYPYIRYTAGKGSHDDRDNQNGIRTRFYL